MKKNTGFTLIELLVAMTIVAILAIIGFTIYNDSLKSARDAKRTADIDALSKAYETKFDKMIGSYKPIARDDFTLGQCPAPPEGGSYLYYGVPTGTGTSPGFRICAQLDGFVTGGTACTQTNSNNK